MRTAGDLGIACLGIQAVELAGNHILDVAESLVVFLDIPAAVLLDSLAVVYLATTALLDVTPYCLPPVAGRQALHQTLSVPAQSDWDYGGGGAW